MTITDQIIQAVRDADRPVCAADLHAMLPNIERDAMRKIASAMAHTGKLEKTVIGGRNYYTVPPEPVATSPFIVTPPHLWGRPGRLPA